MQTGLSNQRSNCQHSLDHRESKGIPEKKKNSVCFTDYAKAFHCVDHNKLWKILKRMGVADHLTCLLKVCMEVKKWQLESDMEQLKDLKLGKKHDKVYILTLVI